MSANHGRAASRGGIRENFRAAHPTVCDLRWGRGGYRLRAEANEPLAMELDHIVPLGVDPTAPRTRPTCARSMRCATDAVVPAAPDADGVEHHRDSHNYSAMAGPSRPAIGRRLVNEHWHSTHPDTPCPCRTTTPDTERTYSP